MFYFLITLTFVPVFSMFTLFIWKLGGKRSSDKVNKLKKTGNIWLLIRLSFTKVS